MGKKFMLGALCLTVVLVTTSVWAADAPGTTGASRGESEPSLTEINKKITNPVSDLWSIAFQQNNFILDMGAGQSERWNSNLNFQPVLPVALTSNWNLITRPVITVFNSVPHPDPNNPGDVERTTGFGDTVLMELLSPSPKLAGNWLLGLGPTFIFPTASSDYTGQGKWQVGPAALVGYLAKKWILGALVQNWTSFGGSGDKDVNQMNLQPIAAYFLPGGWSIGYSGNILANWKADKAGDVWTIPLGLGVSKVVKFDKLPVRIGLGGQYMIHHPDTSGQKWILGALVQNWTSFGGSGDQDVNQMNLQPIAAYFLPGGWSIGYSGNILANWKADKAGDVWSIPLGLGVSKVVKFDKLPVRIGLGGQYMVHHPDTSGQKWNIQLMVVPVIPKLIKGNLIR